MDWKSLESTLLSECESGFEAWLADHPGQIAYALAFHEGYRELDGPITIPQLAVNSLEAVQEGESTQCGERAWNPADWAWNQLLPIDEQPLSEWAENLHEEANRSTQKHWLKTEKRFLSLLVRVAKSLRRKFVRHERTTQDFLVYVSDEAEGLDIVRRCLPRQLYKMHFADYESSSKVDATATSTDRLSEYLEAPWSHEDEILSMGERAIPALLEFLPSKNGYYGASLLGKLGVRDPAVIESLREACGGEGGLADASVRALFRLGDIDFLLEQARLPAVRSRAVAAIASALKSESSGPLDYRLVERLLSSQDPEVVEAVAEQLKPGSSLCEINSSDLDEAFRGLESQHPVIRCHAVSVLGDRGLGRKAAKQVLPRLARRLEDEDATVRRLTLLSLSQWKKAAKPYHDKMRKLKEDSDREVRITATYVFE